MGHSLRRRNRTERAEAGLSWSRLRYCRLRYDSLRQRTLRQAWLRKARLLTEPVAVRFFATELRGAARNFSQLRFAQFRDVFFGALRRNLRGIDTGLFLYIFGI